MNPRPPPPPPLFAGVAAPPPAPSPSIGDMIINTALQPTPPPTLNLELIDASNHDAGTQMLLPAEPAVPTDIAKPDDSCDITANTSAPGVVNVNKGTANQLGDQSTVAAPTTGTVSPWGGRRGTSQFGRPLQHLHQGVGPRLGHHQTLELHGTHAPQPHLHGPQEHAAPLRVR